MVKTLCHVHSPPSSILYSPSSCFTLCVLCVSAVNLSSGCVGSDFPYTNPLCVT
jgi:hypothetical protein